MCMCMLLWMCMMCMCARAAACAPKALKLVKKLMPERVGTRTATRVGMPEKIGCQSMLA